jgi:uncharacterized membrane protein (UPF0136 family)
MATKTVAILVALAGLFVIGGGAMGYVSKGSVESLIYAGAAGVLWLVCAFAIGAQVAWGRPVAIAVGLVLAAGMAWRWIGGASAMPALPVIAISLAVVAVVVTQRRVAA